MIGQLIKLILSGTSAAKADGCPADDGFQQQEMTSMSQTAPVRCCDLLGDNCITPSECLIGTFDQAEEKCASIGMRLCTPNELENNLCCTTGCGFDYKLIWQRDIGK